MDLFYKARPDYASMQQKIQSLKEEFAQLKGFRVFPIGKSALGRDIMAMSIGPLDRPTLYVGGTHALEWHTVLLCFRFFEEVLQAVQNNTCPEGVDIAKSIACGGILVVPCLNPDGLEIVVHGTDAAAHLKGLVEEITGKDVSTWQANARGVDLNHNFDAGYTLLKQQEIQAGITRPAPTQWGGPFCESESETRAIVNLCKTMPVKKLFSFHSQGEEIYYRYGEHTPAQSKLMASLMASSCGYKVCDPQGMASHGGLKDWFINTFARPGFTFEIGYGQKPLAHRGFPFHLPKTARSAYD